jgi:OOP family OmpA-OmpF porin
MPDADQKPSGTPIWLWPLIAVLAIVAIGLYYWTSQRATTAPPVAQTPPATPAPAPVAQTPAATPAPAPVAQTPAATPAPAPVAQTPPATPAPAPVAQTPPATPAPAPVAQTPPATPAPSAVAQTSAATPAPSAVAQTPPATPAPSAVAQTPPATPAPSPAAQAAAVAPATEPPRLELNNEDGVVHVTGAVHDEGAKVSILDALKSVFGADKVQGDITVDANRDPAPWLAKLSDALASLKTGGVEAVFDGDSVNVGGAIGDADRDRIIVALKGALGDSLSFGVLRDHAADPASANGKATNELTSLQSGFAPKDLIATLNKSIVNFPSDSAEVPASMDAFLRSAATDLKQLRAGHVIEIAGYTDNTGDPALNVTLSQKRAEAVRDALIKDGADPAMLIAKGYGSADPIASNDTPEGRLRNRRIEYRVVKTP